MFTSAKIANHVQSVKFAGDEEHPTLQVAFYVTPADYDLVYEISDRVAKQIFRREGSNHVPVQELGKTVLNIGDPGRYNLEVYPHNADGADGAGVMIPACAIGEVYVDKLFSDKPDWSLVWKAVLPLDSHSLDLMRKYFKKTCFITLEPVQDSLLQTDDKKPIILDDAEVESGQPIVCQVCANLATYLGADQSAFCDMDVKAAVGIQVRRIKYREAVE